MNEKHIRYVTRILTLDRPLQSTTIWLWDKDDYEEFLQEENKHYGLKLISINKEISLSMEYSNIIWDYKIYFGSYKKKYRHLTLTDERWNTFEKILIDDLKLMELSQLKDKILNSLKNKTYFEYKKKSKEPFKKYFRKYFI